MATEITVVLYVNDGDEVPDLYDIERALGVDVLEYETEEV